MSRERLPIIIGKNLRKGIMAWKEGSGYNMAIVWLNKNIPVGQSFEREDIDKINAVLHFCDRDTLENTIALLKIMLEETDG